jgi:hypothetical protein
VLVMMTEVDREESEASTGSTSNSATTRTVLALRTIIYSNGADPSLTFQPDLRVVVHLDKPCKYLKAASFAAPLSNRSVLYCQDLSRNINSLMFYCASKPGGSVCLYCLPVLSACRYNAHIPYSCHKILPYLRLMPTTLTATPKSEPKI